MVVFILAVIAVFSTPSLVQGAEIGRVTVASGMGKKEKVLVLSTKNPDIKKIPLNKVVSLHFQFEEAFMEKLPKTSNVQPLSPEQVVIKSINARMPEHGHGMVLSPKITQLDASHWDVDGFKLHMKGAWEIYFSVEQGEMTEKFIIKYYVE
ncbi:MAG: hypothetical protein R3B45_01505 [Bdellovibrionota bacterium]